MFDSNQCDKLIKENIQTLLCVQLSELYHHLPFGFCWYKNAWYINILYSNHILRGMKVTLDDYLLKSREKSLNVSASLYFRIISLHPYVYRNLGLRCYKTEDFVADGDIVINDQIILRQAPTIDFNAKTMKQGRWRNLFCVLLLKAKFGSSQGRD